MKFCRRWLIDNAEFPCIYTLQHCDFYKRLNFLTLYTCQIKNPKIMTIISIILILTLYSIITYITKKFFSNSVEKIWEKLQLNPVIASISLIAFANSLPDLITTTSSDKEMDGPYFILSSLIGGFLFNSTFTISYVIYKSGRNLKLNAFNILKEMFFLLFVFGSFLGIGYFKKMIDFSIVYYFIIVYVCYFSITMIISSNCKMDMDSSVIKNNNKKSKIPEKTKKRGKSEILIKKKSKRIEEIQNYLSQKDKLIHSSILIEPEENTYFIDQQNEVIKEISKKSKSIEKSKSEKTPPVSKFSINFLDIPIKFFFSLTITSKNNKQFNNDYLRYPIIIITTHFIFFTIQNSFIINYHLSLLICLSLIILDYFTDILNSKVGFYIFELMSILSCICWMLNCIYFILDLFFLISIFLSVSNIILTVVIISIGNQLIGNLIRFF